ncbi:10551_t:CDS:2 [Racocetra persica]|uniref:10551_t:CDS:1 n=1 Tax=Racocetra persica TaxID=160502 RepID=A0ACA9KD69_9GLOM|nr:10551_t:CDS:2 [Racocetra persica]
MDFTNKESAEMIKNNPLNSNELDLNDTVYFESKTTIPLDYPDTYNNSVLSEDDYHDISNYYNNSVRSDDNNYMATQSCYSVDEDESDNNGTDDELHLELVVGISFSCWDSFKAWLNCFALHEGFDYKIRMSEADDKGIIRRATYVCTKASTHSPNVTVDPTKHRNAKSQRTKCSWKLCVTYPKTIARVKINSFCNVHLSLWLMRLLHNIAS